MIRILIVLGALMLAPATEAQSGFATRNMSPSLAFLSELAGKTPGEANVFSNPAMNSRLHDLLKKDAALVAIRFQTAGPIDKNGDMVAMWGNKAHDGGVNDAFIAVNTKTSEMWVWLRVQKRLKRYGPAADPSGLSADAATALGNIKDESR